MNEELSQELYRPVIKKLNRRRVSVRFKDTVWATDLAEMTLLFCKN